MRDAGGELKTLGVLDLDSTVLATFDEEDLKGLTRVVEILAESCNVPF